MSDLSSEELRENFDHFDSNHDGRIDHGEFIALMKALDAFESEQDADVGFNAVDVDGSGLVEFDEFARWFASR